MKFYMKQKVFSWKDKFSIYDEYQKEKYSVEGQFLSFGKKLHLYDASGTEVRYIHEKVFALRNTYFVSDSKQDLVKVSQRFSFKPKYDIESLGAGSSWFVQGDFFAHNYEIIDNGTGHPIATVQKAWLSWGDLYEIEIFTEDQTETILATVLCIDAAIERNAAAVNAATSANS